jgi:hypothetical protein
MLFAFVPSLKDDESFKPDFEGFHRFMQEHYPHIIGRKRFCCTQEEATKELHEACWKFRFILQPISEFKETTFTAAEMAALKLIVDYAASCCGGGEDTIGAIMYTGGFHLLKDGDKAVVNLAKKIDCYGD